MNKGQIGFRIAFFVLNLILAALGLILIIIGAVLIANSSSLIDSFSSITSDFNFKVFLNSAIILIVVGIVLIIIAGLGMIGTIKHKIFAILLIVYIVVIVVIIIIQIIGAILAFVYQEQIIGFLQSNNTIAILSRYEADTGLMETIDRIQIQFDCCGITNYKDYNLVNISIPLSCVCASQDCVNISQSAVPNTNNITLVYDIGCFTVAENALGNTAYQYALGGVALAVLVLEILIILFATCLVCLDFKSDSEFNSV